MNFIQTLVEKAREQKKEPEPVKPDLNLVFVAHCVHAMAMATPSERQLVRRFSQKNWGDLPPEETLDPLPVLPEQKQKGSSGSH